jgi:hypothetical protein
MAQGNPARLFGKLVQTFLGRARIAWNSKFLDAAGT